MPRKPRSVKTAKAQPTLTPESSQPTLTPDQAACEASPDGRDREGRFAKGNQFGPGNPHARHCARKLALFRDAISDDEMQQIFRMLYEKAVGGDMAAAKLILSYKIGKPLPAPHPDSIDRDEWDHYQQDTMNLKQAQSVLSSLASHQSARR
jgi:hypothetical protein